MKAIFLQDCLKKELKQLFNGLLLKNSNGKDSEIHVHEQYLPASESSKYEDSEADPFPYVVVRIASGNDDEASECKIQLIVGVFDDDITYKGYKDVLMLVEKMRQFFVKKKYFGDRNEFEFKSSAWVLDEEEAYPYFIGGMETTWEIPLPELEAASEMI